MRERTGEEAISIGPRPSSPRFARIRRLAGIALITAVTVLQASYYKAETAGLGETSTLVIALLYAATYAVIAQRVARDPDERRFWKLFTVCGGLVLAGRVYLALTGDTSLPSPATYLDLAAAMVFLAGVALTTRFRDASVGARLRYLADLVATFTVAFIVAFSMLLRPMFDSLRLPLAARVAASVYPAAGLVMVFATLGAVIVSGRRSEMWERLLSLGFAIAGAACIVWPFWYVDLVTPIRWVATPIIETLWVAGVGTLGCAIMFRVTSGSSAWRPTFATTSMWHSPYPTERVAWSVYLLATPLFGWWSVTAPLSERSVLLVGAMLLAAVAVLRATIVSAEGEKRARWSDHDPLTRLLEPNAFRARLESAVAVARRHDEYLSVVVLDIDDFTYFNQAGGYERGDRLLREVSKVLRAMTGPHDLAGHCDSDQFAIALPGVPIQLAEEWCARLRAECAHLPYGPTLSGGIAIYPVHARDAETLVANAAEAMRIAKLEGKDRVIEYDREAIEAFPPAERLRLHEERSRVETVRLVAESVDARHPTTAGHSRRVAMLASALGSRIGLSRRRIRLLEIAALVHDVGKVGVSDDILRKPEGLRDDEWRLVREHPELSARLVEATGLSEVAQWVAAHHERWDGSGYPAGLAGDEIPLEARILGLCDAYDAIVSERPWRPALPPEEACREIRRNAGSQFDPILARRLVAMLEARVREAS